jgi:hypothetical protein
VLDLEARVDDVSGKGDDEKSSYNSNKHSIGEVYGRKLNIEKRDVWDMKWAEDNDEMIAVSFILCLFKKKNKINILMHKYLVCV